MRYLIFSSNFIKHNWVDHFKAWTDIKTVDDYLTRAKEGKVILGGAQLIVQDKLPPPA